MVESNEGGRSDGGGKVKKNKVVENEVVEGTEQVMHVEKARKLEM